MQVGVARCSSKDALGQLGAVVDLRPTGFRPRRTRSCSPFHACWYRFTPLAVPPRPFDTTRPSERDRIGPTDVPRDLARRPDRRAARRRGAVAAEDRSDSFSLALLWPNPHDGHFPRATRAGMDRGTKHRRRVPLGGKPGGSTPALAAELVRLKVDVIVTSSTPAAQAAKRATTTIPIVVTFAADPVGSGLVASLARPGGNITGLTTLAGGLVAKRLEVLKWVASGATSLASLWQP